MIDFIAQISFDRACKEKKIHLVHNPKTVETSCLINSYQDEAAKIKYSVLDNRAFIKKTSDKKFLALAFIYGEDRQKLRHILKVSDADVRTDPELLLELYLKFGEDSLKTMSNGFIFVLVDYRKKTVRAFRDHIGIKNICYYHSDNSVYLSSSFKNLFKLKHLPHTPNQDKLNKFLMLDDKSPSDTFTNEIKRVPPMNALKFYQNKINIYKYSSYEINSNYTSYPSQIKGLKKLLFNSVAIDSSSNYSRIGFLFSGGIDSSTIISFFRKQKRTNEEIYSFSAQYKQIDNNIKHLIDESEYQNEILRLDDVKEFSFNGEDESTLSNLDFYLEIIGQPFFFPNLYLSNMAFNLAHENNVDIVMNGNDGDSIVSHGYEYLLELFFSLRWIKLYKMINANSKVRRQSKKFIFNETVLKKLSFQNLLSSSSKKKHIEAVMSNSHNKAIEIQSLLADYYSIDERYPFYNREIIEYCINVSPELKNNKGRSRYILYEATKGIVPEKIRTRTTKSNLGHALCLGFINRDHNIIYEQLSEPHTLIKDLIDINNLQKSWKKLLSNPRKYSARSLIPAKIFSYTVLNKWLNDNYKNNRNA